MARVAIRLLFPLAAWLLGAGCGANAGQIGGQGTVSCAKLCEAEAACLGGDAGYRQRCLDECAEISTRCRAQIGQTCLACYQACDADCVEVACDCGIEPGQPGDPCTDDRDCLAGSICYDRAYCVGDGPLRVSLSFHTDSDFDVHLRTPNGHEIYFGADEADGGTLDVDQCVMPCGTGQHVENIVFREHAPGGEYELWVVNYNGRGGGEFRLEVAKADGDEYFHGTLPQEAYAESRRFRFFVYNVQP